jgi:hypothetical protein
MRTISLPEDNFKNKVSSLQWQRAQVIAIPQVAINQVDFETEPAWGLRKLRNNCSSGNSGTPSHSVGRETATRSGRGEEGALTWESSDSEGPGGWWPHLLWLEQAPVLGPHYRNCTKSMVGGLVLCSAFRSCLVFGSLPNEGLTVLHTGPRVHAISLSLIPSAHRT